MDLVVKIYEVTSSFPKEETFGLSNQIKRSAVSIPSNIAEGAGRNSKKDFQNFLGISYASSCELETQLIIANRLKYIDDSSLESFQNEITEIQKMNWALKKSLI